MYLASKGAKLFAIKRIPKDRLGDACMDAKIATEVACLSKARSPYVVGLHEALQDVHNAYIITEHVPHGSLESHVGMSQRQVMFVVQHLFHALERCHDSGITHGDVKPANVMLGRHARPVLIDFGSASLRGPERAISCTPWYAAPEVFGKTRGPPSDVFSAGVVAFELMFPGSHPYLHDSDSNPAAIHEKLVAVLADNVRPSVPPASTSPLLDVVLECLDPVPSARPSAQNAAALVAKCRRRPSPPDPVSSVTRI